ncbi:hypothetical protein GLOIN_2v1769118 [Rhizophagus irregularis DAOM 181602=DAOM 197198]|uniref:Uncharacterized protein n=1 Tax=Rhizophagus irregularis (strain DAOM 181602 / DAOM 197198 / MUCL 43194) TaxID=747089 RepID=A0A2P4QF89_RHIID|nr:hypothetical protein GLOIN_2v1769118 [Rhizophagus irregularis DAOM 181602=DAOM 197198]POG76315.1 hypothetical protein GLOIN_2v1769118 [Rhizophagus irregularis DAOM 181602=DAOM 197198]|eukprot:XP_025183181.1 hypothetical protein GLOIN_2v1769118 [Rhizophagus irregularis DAOM 181602=DAOM 197198]
MLCGLLSPSAPSCSSYIYNEFVNEFDFTIDLKIIEDIYNQTTRHAGLVCLCGRSIQNNLVEEIEMTSLAFQADKNAKPAIDLLQSRFSGVLDFVTIYNDVEDQLAQFLVAEGVLIRDEMTKYAYKMSSSLIDMLIWQRVIPLVYKSFPKNIISSAFDKSYKVADDLYVNGIKNIQVPQESVYDTELCRVLVNWIVKAGGIEVDGQWHIVENCDNRRNKHLYSNIVITADHQRIVLELLATATQNDLDEHFKSVLKYAELLSADEIWIVHFMCEDGYTARKLHWPLNDKINVIHFFHNRRMLNVLMNARYADSNCTIKFIVDQVVPLQS